jgi:RNA polymerase sigma factor (sigma-70 family)
VDVPSTIEVATNDAVDRALRVLEITKARSGALVLQRDFDVAVLRFGLSAKQIASLERRAEEKKLIALRVSQEERSVRGESNNDFDIIAAFRSDVGKVKLMTVDEEIEFGDAVSFGVSAEKTLKDPDQDLDDDERQRLAESVQRGKTAYGEFIRRNVPLVMKIANANQFRGLELPDLIQNGLIGLMRAVERWDPHRGYRFSTFATYWIRQRIDRGLADTGRAIRLPVHVVQWQGRISRAERDLSRELNRTPTVHEISDAIGLAPDKVALYSDLGDSLISLDAPAVEETGTTLGDFQATKDAGPSSVLIANERTDVIIGLLKQLPKRQCLILIKRFGLDGCAPMTLEDIGLIYGITRERVRQLEAKALAKVRVLISHSSMLEVLKP